MSRVPLLFFLVVHAVTAARGATWTVGFDPVDCDWTDLQQAIDAASSGDTLQLDVGEFVGAASSNFNIVSKSLTIAGGYQDCSGSRTSQRTTLTGGGSDSVVETWGSGSRFLILDQLTIQGGETDVDGGGGVGIEDDFDVTLLGVHVTNNESDLGGGISIDGTAGATLFVGYGSRVGLNHATVAGGGIRCQNGGTVAVFGPAEIDRNTTGGDGGGISAVGGGTSSFTGDCEIELKHLDGEGVRVTLNEALGNGGGIHLNDSWLGTEGGSTGAIEIAENEAGPNGNVGWGGGLFVTGRSAFLKSTRVTDNRADRGGGIFLNDLATLYFHPSDLPCVAPPCQLVAGNDAELGAALAIRSGADTWFRRTVFRDNGDATSEVTVAYVEDPLDSNPSLELVNSLVARNGVPEASGIAAIQSVGGGLIFLTGTTLADNVGISSVLDLESNSIYFRNVLFWGNEGDVVHPDDSGVFVGLLDCIAMPAGSNLPGTPTVVSHQDPGFEDPASFDYHLEETSAVRDLCPNNHGGRDLDGDLRSLGLGTEPGSDEISLPIFDDGFESGDTSAWFPTPGT